MVSFFILISQTSCNRFSNESKIDWLILPRVVSPSKELIYVDNEEKLLVLDSFYIKDLRVHVYINGNCKNCVDNLNLWSDFLMDTEIAKEYDFIFYVHSFDYNSFKILKNTFVHFTYPLVFDAENVFFDQNEFLDVDLSTHQLITNKDNKFVVHQDLLSGSEILTNIYKLNNSN